MQLLKKACLLPALFILALASCSEDSFSTVVDIDLPEHEPLPALTADLRAGDTLLYSYLGLSRGVVDQPESADLSVNFQAFKNGLEIVNLDYILNNTGGTAQDAGIAERISFEPAEYMIRATVAGFDPVEATQTMPTVPDFSDVSFERDGAVDLNGFRVDDVAFTLRDDPATTDYYGVRVVSEPNEDIWCRFQQNVEVCDTFYRAGFEPFLTSNDPLLKYGYGYGLVFTDQAFDNDDYRVTFQFDNFSRDTMILEVYHLTEDAYRYAISREAYLNAEGNPFAEPVNIHNNIDGGYGYFVLANRAFRRLD